MKLKHYLFFAAICIISHHALAADSASNRDSIFFIEMSPFGLGKEIRAPFPFTIGINPNQNLSAGVQIGSVNSDYQQGDLDEETSYSNVGIVVRYFAYDIFNIIAAVHQREWKGNIIERKEPDIYAEADLKASSSVATVGIGNQWVSDFGFTWGFDWFVSSIAISSSYSISNINNQGFTSGELQQLKDKAKRTADIVNEVSSTPAMLILNIGWYF